MRRSCSGRTRVRVHGEVLGVGPAQGELDPGADPHVSVRGSDLQHRPVDRDVLRDGRRVQGLERDKQTECRVFTTLVFVGAALYPGRGHSSTVTRRSGVNELSTKQFMQV